ncbi:hypothetical protein DPMN_178689 [Dreissena polymorpha]|uniref:Uncharacterized protein n=1 Tax=Dreissena polymorpha TaxID=45954 RepID=A0A9D4EB34_DREPO|nr:hypothetical protein DPMN_178689 [Dreissena polymorpha]
MDTVAKDTSEDVERIEKIEHEGIGIEGARRRISDLERDNNKLREDINYMQSQSLINNLIFDNIPIKPNETPTKCEKT